MDICLLSQTEQQVFSCAMCRGTVILSYFRPFPSCFLPENLIFPFGRYFHILSELCPQPVSTFLSLLVPHPHTFLLLSLPPSFRLNHTVKFSFNVRILQS